MNLRLRVSLRAMLIAVTLLVLWLGMRVHRAQRQREAIEALGAAVVIWDYQLLGEENPTWNPNADPPYPTWLRRLTGEGFFSNVRGLAMVSFQTEDALARLSNLPELETLSLTGREVDDASLVIIGNLRKLKTLNLDSTAASDEGMAALSGSQRLESLSLNYTTVTDAGLIHLSRLPALKSLHVEGTTVSAAGVGEFKKALPDCEVWFGPESSPQSDLIPANRAMLKR